MSFPADIKGCMKDCILSLFWPRKDIVGFFEKYGCTRAEIAAVQIEGENALKRHEVIDRGEHAPMSHHPVPRRRKAHCAVNDPRH